MNYFAIDKETKLLHYQVWEDYKCSQEEEVISTDVNYFGGMTLPKWNGVSFIEGENPEKLAENQILYLNQVKESCISQSKKALNDFLANNPLPSTCHNNTLGFYNVTNEKQSLLTRNYLSYQLEKQLGINPVFAWNETGKSCEEWTEEEVIQLMLSIQAYVQPLVSKQQRLEKQIKESTSLEELERIEVSYEEFTPSIS